MSSNVIGGKYEIIDVIGRGTAGTIYAAKDQQTGQDVALKSLHSSLTNSAEEPELRRFEQEARIAGSVDSAHIAKVFDIGTDSETGEVYLVMELLQGEDADAVLTRLGPLPPLVALRIVADACLGLGAVHARGVVHRDIKPGNLFLARSENGEISVKVIDFGLAKIRRLGPEERKTGLAVSKIPLTATGQLLGTPHYMSPEHVEGARHVDAQSDVFSLGVTLYALLTGAPPNADCSAFVDLLHRITQGKTRPVREVAPWVPEEIAAVVEKAMRASKAERFSDMLAMRKAIEVLLPQDFKLNVDSLVETDRTPITPSTTLGEPKDSSVAIASKTEPEILVGKKTPSKGPFLLGLVGVVVVCILIAIVSSMQH